MQTTTHSRKRKDLFVPTQKGESMTEFTIHDSKKPSLNIGDVSKPDCVLIATPMYGGMCTGHFTLGIINTINRFRQLGIECHLATLMNESLITRARNELARMFLDDEKFTHLMFIDADIYFEYDAVEKLFNHDEDIICALYPKKEINWERVRKAVERNRKDLNYYASNFAFNLPLVTDDIKLNNKGLLEVRHAGTGFMMIKRKVFEKLSSHVPEYRSSTLQDPSGKYIKPIAKQFFDTSIDSTGALLSEDYHFCELWSNHGGKVFVDLNIHLKHIGTHIFEADTSEMFKNGKNI